MSQTTSYVEQEFLENTLKYLIKYPKELKIKRKADGMGILYTVNLHNDDVFRVIGKEGKIVNAIRVLLKSIGYSHKVRASLKIETLKK